MPAKRKPAAKKGVVAKEVIAQENAIEESLVSSSGFEEEVVQVSPSVKIDGGNDTITNETVADNETVIPVTNFESNTIEIAQEISNEEAIAIANDEQVSDSVKEDITRNSVNESDPVREIDPEDDPESESREDTRNYRPQSPEESKIVKDEAKIEVVQRNKRMFGSLLGHLGLAKRKLERDSELIGKQTAVNTAVIQKNNDELQRVNDLKLNESISNKIEAKKQKLESLTAAWKAKTEPLANFIFTKTEPRIPWLPVQHTAATTSLLEARRVEVSKWIEDREAEDVQTLVAFEATLPARPAPR